MLPCHESCEIIRGACHASVEPSGQRFETAAGVWTETFHLSEGLGFYPSVASHDDGRFVVVWGGESPTEPDEKAVVGRRFSPSGEALAAEFQINQTTLDSFLSGAVVGIDEPDEFLVAWQGRDARDDNASVLFRRFDTDGNPLHDEVAVSPVYAFPRLAVVTPGDSLIAWMGEGSMFGRDHPLFLGRRFDRSGNPRGGEFPLSLFEVALQFDSTRPAIGELAGTTAGQVIAAFPVGDDLYGRLLPTGGLLQLSDGPEQPFSELGESDGTVHVGVLRVGGAGDRVTVDYFTMDSGGGAAAGEDYLPAAGRVVFEEGELLKTFPLEVLDDGRREGTESFLVGLRNPSGTAALGDPAAVEVTLFDNDTVFPGHGPLALGDEIAVNDVVSGEQRYPRVAAAPGGEFLVVWQSLGQDGDGWGVFGRLFDAEGRPQGDELRLSDATAAGQFRPAAAATPEGDFVVVWSDEAEDSYFRHELLGRRVVASGTGPRLEEELRLDFCISCDSTFSQEVAVDGDGNFVVSWTHQVFDESTSPPSLWAQRFTVAGEPIGSYNDSYFTYSYGKGTGVSSTATGEFVVVWNHAIRPGLAYLSGRPFDPSVPPHPDDDFTIEPEPFGNQEAHAGVVHQDEERLLVVWQQEDDPGAPASGSLISRIGRDVLGRRLRVDGEPLSETFRLDSFRPGAQKEPRVAAAPSGKAVAVWTSEDQLGPGRSDIFARRFAAAGNPLGERFPVNPSLRPQSAPAVAADADGNFVVVWEERTGDGDVDIFAQRFSGSSCVPRPRTLCLRQGRFALRVDWKDFQGATGRGQAVALTEDTGAFWFFNPDNVELAVKVLDGRAFTGHYWVFYGALSNTEFTLTVTDTETGTVKTYFNPLNTFASVGDTRALPGEASAPLLETSSRDVTPRTAGCAGDETVLCLGSERFRIEVEWEDFAGATGTGTAFPLTDDTGAFWFFNPANLELVVKVLDGRAFTGHYWVFYGSLSNVGFTVTVSDTVTGASQSYVNPVGSFASVGDVRALPGE